MSYYCWMQYYDSETHKQTSSDEIMYCNEHRHGAQPSEDQWAACLTDLVKKVNDIRAQNNLDSLTAAAIKAGAESKTRSEH